MQTVIYHNPRCSKSRTTLALLRERGVEVRVVEYLKDTPSRAELKRVLNLLGRRPPDMVRFSEATARELGLSPDDVRTEDEWLELLVANPVLIERPIVVAGRRAAIGRPPEKVLEIL